MEVNHRFSINSYMHEKLENPPLDSVSNKFLQLVKKSQASLQERLNCKDLQEVFKNKSVAMLFLDKIAGLIGQYHPNSVEAKKFMGSPSSYPSLELIRHLTLLISEVNSETAQNIESWIEAEQSCLMISLIFDAWGAKNEEAVVRATTKGNYSHLPTTYKIEPPTDEVETFIYAIANEIRAMQPSDVFKMPAGSVNHVTRLQLIKKDNGTFDVFHFNTGLGLITLHGKESTACKYRSVPADTLENPLFWKQLVNAKMQPSMSILNNLLFSLDAAPIDIMKWLKKPPQASGSCAFHAVEAEFKHSFIKSFPSVEEGWTAYKQCTSLMALNAIEHEASELEPSIAKMLTLRGKTRQRYLDWMELDRETLKSTINAYLDAFNTLKQDPPSIEGLPSLMVLSMLDKRLNDALNFCSYKELEQIRNTHGFGLKQSIWLESTKEVLQEAVAFAGWNGHIILKIRSLSQAILPAKWNSVIQTKLNYAILDQASMQTLLTEYSLREDPAVLTLGDDFIYDGDVLYTHIKYHVRSNPNKVLELAKMPMETELRKDILIRTCEKLSQASHFEHAIEIAGLLETPEKEMALTEIAIHYVILGQIQKAIELTNQQPEIILEIIDDLVKNGILTNALKFAERILDDKTRHLAVENIALALAKQGKQKAAMNAIIDLPTFCQDVHEIVFCLCKENHLNDAILFVSHLPTESYPDMDSALQYLISRLKQGGREQDATRLYKRYYK